MLLGCFLSLPKSHASLYFSPPLSLLYLSTSLWLCLLPEWPFTFPAAVENFKLTTVLCDIASGPVRSPPLPPHYRHTLIKNMPLMPTTGAISLFPLAYLLREFGRWKVNNLAVERREFLESPLTLTPEFVRNIRMLGRRPSTQMITDNLIRKYGTHFLLSATLGGKHRGLYGLTLRRLSVACVRLPSSPEGS